MPEVFNILAFDYGDRKIGLARASSLARLPQPLTVLQNDDSFSSKLTQIIKDESIGLFVVGLPRNMQGAETAQSEKCRAFADRISQEFDIKTVLHDETLTTKLSDDELKSSKSGISDDALAAVYILDSFLPTLTGENHD